MTMSWKGKNLMLTFTIEIEIHIIIALKSTDIIQMPWEIVFILPIKNTEPAFSTYILNKIQTKI